MSIRHHRGQQALRASANRRQRVAEEHDHCAIGSVDGPTRKDVRSSHERRPMRSAQQKGVKATSVSVANHGHGGRIARRHLVSSHTRWRVHRASLRSPFNGGRSAGQYRLRQCLLLHPPRRPSCGQPMRPTGWAKQTTPTRPER